MNLEDTVKPDDSVSQIASRVSRKSRSQVSSRSSVSSVRLREEAKLAALEARAATLKQKQAIENQERQLQQQKELLELETELNATAAKANVYRQYESRSVNALCDGVSTKVHLNFDKDNPSASSPDVTIPYEFSASKPGKAPLNPIARVFTPVKADIGFQVDEPVNSNEQKDNILCQLLQKQNSLTEMLVEHQKKASLPRCEMRVFDGKLQQYRSFISAFDHNIGTVAVSNKDKLQLLWQYTSGRPKQIVAGCMGRNPDTGYANAREELEQEYGDPYLIAQAYQQDIEHIDHIKHEDRKKLKEFLTFIIVYRNAMDENEVMKGTDPTATIQKLVEKLPFKLRDKWRNAAYRIRTHQHRMANFDDFVSFTREQVNIITDSVYGNIADITVSKDVKPKPKLERKTKGTSFATQVRAVSEGQESARSGVKSDSDSSSVSRAFERPCLFCGEGHNLDECEKLRHKPHEEKLHFLRSKGLCFRCLYSQHISRNCTRPRMQCSVCGMKHPSVLHISKRNTEDTSENLPVLQEQPTVVKSTCVSMNESTSEGSVSETKGALSIVPVRVKSRDSDRYVQTYAFLDNGSTDTFCTERLVQKLNLNGRNTKIMLRTLRQNELVDSQVITDLEVCDFEGNNVIKIAKAYTQTEMPVCKSDITTKIDTEKWPYLSEVNLPEIDSDVDILIGNNAPGAMEPWEVVNSQNNGPYAVRTRLGWVVNGPLGIKTDHTYDDADNPRVSVNRISVVEDLAQQMESQFNCDFCERISEDTPQKSREDLEFLRKMSQSVTKQDGHYQTCLPFKSKCVSMPNNRAVAEQSMTHLKRKFQKDIKFYTDYGEFMNNMIQKGYAEMIPETEIDRKDGKLWYIPHHGIYHPKKNKIRVVFNCASKFQGISLNDTLLQGPDLTNSLVGVLLRFRQDSVAFMADIEAMFYQVRVSPDDTDMLRFLWWPNGDLTQNPKEYRMLVHIFGATSSPSCSNFVLKKIAEDNQGSTDSEVLRTITHNFYVDDCLKSVPSEADASGLIVNLRKTCAEGGFNLTKWVCNRKGVLESPSVSGACVKKDLDLDHNNVHIERALGVEWCIESDKFMFRIHIKERPLTRRGILSIVSSVYDPLDFLAPFLLLAKQILQDLCRSKFAWEEEIPQTHLHLWRRWLADLPMLKDFGISRCLKPENFGEIKSAQIHHFSDASEMAYGTVSYLRIVNESGKVHCSFLMGKSRVAPIKQITIPRMELTAATVAVRVDKMLKRELEIKIDDSFFWTDSMSVIRYISNETTRFRTFVANRVAVILDGSTPVQWNYVDSASNPADDASRGLHAGKLTSNHRWIRGPELLWDTDLEHSVCSDLDCDMPEDDPEVRKKVLVSSVVTEGSNDAIDRFISHHSSWYKLKKHAAWILKVRKTLRKRIQTKLAHKDDSQMSCDTGQAYSNKGPEIKSKRNNTDLFLTTRDLDEAEHAVLAYVQRKAFPHELDILTNPSKVGDRLNNDTIPKASPLYKLDPFVENGLLRVGGRLGRTSLPQEAKHPVVLPKGSHVSHLILHQIHQDTSHSGRNHMLATMRQKYWILKAYLAARRIVHNCVNCRRQRGKAGEQKMADLPADRVTIGEPPFTRVGIDYFGPFMVKRGRSVVKRYGVIFTCLTIRAVHIEISHALDTDSCVNALRRFMARRGQVKVIRSDNGTNLVGAKRELAEEINKWNHNKIREELLQKNVDWIFNPPLGSHHGGVWERQIRTIRKILNTLLHNQTLDDECL